MVQPGEHTLRDLSAPNVNQQPFCITNPATIGNFKLKSRLIHLLPSFSGRVGEDPHKNLKEFHIVCDGMGPNDVIIDEP